MRHLFFSLLCAVVLLSQGCATMTGSSSQDTAAPTEPPMSAGFYYDFNDIRVPEEMELQTDKSSITPVQGGKAGVMKFKGRVEPISLFDFFANTMPKDGWTMLTYQKYQRYLLVFSKDNRIVVMTIEEDPIYYTWLEIWVSMRVPGAASPAYSTGAMPLDSYPAAPTGGAGLESERTLSQ